MRRVGAFLFPLAVAVVCALTACGGGGGGTTPSISGGSGSGGSGTGGSGSGTTSTGTATATFAVALQQYAPVQTTAVKRRVAFLSPATAQIAFTLVSVNGVAQTGATQTFAVGPTAPNCGSTSGIVNCTLSAALPIGSDVISASTLDANGHSLGTSQIQATVAQNTTNRIALAVGGTIASLQVYLSKTQFTPGTAGTANVIVVPLDSSGAAIVNPGNYNPPITLSMTGSTAHFDLITDGGTPALTGTINSPNDQVVLSFDGSSGSGSINVVAAAGTGVASAQASAGYNTQGFNISPGGAQFQSISSYLFTSAGQSDPIFVSGGTPPYTITSSDPTVATVSGTASPFTVTSVGYGVAGTTTITVSDSATPTHASTTIPVTFQAPAIALTVGSCGANATCTPNSLTGPQVASTINATGGTGTYSYIFVSSGTTTSSYATVAQVGNQFTITPNGSGNDALIVASGNASTYIGIISNQNALVNSLPKAFGFRIGNSTSIVVGGSGETISSCSRTTGTLNGFTFVPGFPASIFANAASPSHGTITCTDSIGYSAVIPFSVYSISFGTYQGLYSVNNPNATADEAFTTTGQSDAVTVVDPGGTLAAVTSGDTHVVSISGLTNYAFTVTSVGAGTTTVTLTDTTGASVSYNVSVTTTTIPIAGKTRQTP
jgi:hypothetical protein